MSSANMGLESGLLSRSVVAMRTLELRLLPTLVSLMSTETCSPAEDFATFAAREVFGDARVECSQFLHSKFK